jgi:hypothetical protein
LPFIVLKSKNGGGVFAVLHYTEQIWGGIVRRFKILRVILDVGRKIPIYKWLDRISSRQIN